MFKANINWSTQQDCWTYETDMASLVLCEIHSTNSPTTQPKHTTPGTAHELAHLSCIAHAFKTCADELRPVALAEENMFSSCSSYSSFWAEWASSCSSYSSPWENMGRWAILYSSSFENMCRGAITYSSSQENMCSSCSSYSSSWANWASLCSSYSSLGQTCEYELSSIAQALITCADEVSPKAQAGKTRADELSPIAQALKTFAAIAYSSSLQNMCRWATAYSSSRGKHV